MQLKNGLRSYLRVFHEVKTGCLNFIFLILIYRGQVYLFTCLHSVVLLTLPDRSEPRWWQTFGTHEVTLVNVGFLHRLEQQVLSFFFSLSIHQIYLVLGRILALQGQLAESGGAWCVF